MKNIVVKLGTSTLTEGKKTLSRSFMRGIAEQVVTLKKQGVQIALVSSGSVCAGRELLHDRKIHRSLPEKQMLAAVGQVELMRLWSDIFAEFDLSVGQLLLTRGDFSNRERYLNARNTIESLLEHNIIPIINENDTVATQEIKVGDNDTLSALVSNLIGADLLILLTDQEGLYTANPELDKTAQVIEIIEKIDESVFKLVGKIRSVNGLGTGGMQTKLEAAQLATNSGTTTVIANAKVPNIIIQLSEGKSIGSRFPSKITATESRKRWLLSETAQGEIHVDQGAAAKIRSEGASLLPIGITQVIRPFNRGAIVKIISPSGKPCAMGITNYSQEEISKIQGTHSSDIDTLLGYSYGSEVIHRDNLAVIKE